MPLTNLSEAFKPFGELRRRQIGGQDQRVANLGDLARKPNSNRQDLFELANNYKSDNYNYVYSGKKDWAIINKDIKDLEAPTNTSVAPSFVPVDTQAQSTTSDADLLASLGPSVSSGDLTTDENLDRNRAANVDQIQADLARSGLARESPNASEGIRHQRDVIDRTWNRPTGAEVDDLRRSLTQSGRVMARNPTDKRPVTMIPAPGEGTDLTQFLEQSGLGEASTAGKTQVQPITGLVQNPSAKQLQKEGMKTDTGGVCSDEHCLTQLNHILACEDCVNKLRKLIGGGPTNIMGLELPELNLAKVIFWVVLIFLIVAVYEMLNRLVN